MRNVDREKFPEFPDVPIDVYDWGIDVNLKGLFYHPVGTAMRCSVHSEIAPII
jgi:hypothetical protein